MRTFWDGLLEPLDAEVRSTSLGDRIYVCTDSGDAGSCNLGLRWEIRARSYFFVCLSRLTLRPGTVDCRSVSHPFKLMGCP